MYLSCQCAVSTGGVQNISQDLAGFRGKALEHRQRRKQKEGETETYKKKLEVV